MKKLFKFIFKLIATVLVIAIIVIVAFGAYLGVVGYKEYKTAIEECPIEVKINELTSMENYVQISEVPEIYKEAVIAVEDHNFYDHGAVSVVSTARAILINFKNREYTEGGSTITQQVAKNLYFTQEKTLKRKAAEMFMAIELEKRYEKDEIFEFYINNIYYGSGYYNIYDASMGYYGVTPDKLSDYQATQLAGVPNAPSVYSPDNNTPLTAQRQQKVLDSMVKYGYLDRESADKILSEGE
jgi:membrane peptidoglycan carboxypeptidase